MKQKNRNIFIRIIAAIFSFSLLSSASPATAYNPLLMIQTNSHEKGKMIVMYEEPSLNSKVIAKYYSGVSGKGEHPDGEWTAVTIPYLEGVEGYCLTEQLERQDDESSYYLNMDVDFPFAVIDTLGNETIDVYKRPQFEDDTEGEYVNGVIVRILGYVGDFAYIQCGYEKSYILSEDLEETNEASSLLTFNIIEEVYPQWEKGGFHLYSYPSNKHMLHFCTAENASEMVPLRVVAYFGEWAQIELLNGRSYFLLKDEIM